MFSTQDALCKHPPDIRIVVYSPNIVSSSDIHTANNGGNCMVHMERGGVQISHHGTSAPKKHGRMGDGTHRGKM